MIRLDHLATYEFLYASGLFTANIRRLVDTKVTIASSRLRRSPGVSEIPFLWRSQTETLNIP